MTPQPDHAEMRGTVLTAETVRWRMETLGWVGRRFIVAVLIAAVAGGVITDLIVFSRFGVSLLHPGLDLFIGLAGALMTGLYVVACRSILSILAKEPKP